MHSAFRLICLTTVLLAAASAAHAQETTVPHTITYQGYLTDTRGNPVTGTVDMTVELTRDGRTVWREAQQVGIENGLYTLQLGRQVALTGGLLFPADLLFPGDMLSPGHLQSPAEVVMHTRVEGEMLSPGQTLSLVPYAGLAHGLYNTGDLILAAGEDAGILLNSDTRGAQPGRFSVWAGTDPQLLFEVAEGEQSAEATLAGSLRASGGLMMRYPPPQGPWAVPDHFAAASHEALNLLSGNAVFGETGEAEITLPEWFMEANEVEDVRYSLTPVGAAMPELHVAEPVSERRFRVAGGVPGRTVSWQVTTVRNRDTLNH